MKEKIKITIYNFIILIFIFSIFEMIFGYWFKKDNFGIHMRNERNKNWKTTSRFNDKEYNFFYKRNFYGFRGGEFDPKDVKIIFNGGSTSNQRYTPENLTIVGLINRKFKKDGIKIKVYNAATNGKSLRGIIYDFNFWFKKIDNFKPQYIILYLGINERTLAHKLDEKQFDIRVKDKKIDQLKDYFKNNSFTYSKYIQIKNKYFPKNTSGYFLDYSDLYKDFRYFDYNQAKRRNYEFNNEEKLILNQLERRLEILKEIFSKERIKPIIITQVEYNGLSNKKLFLVNEFLKKYSIENNIDIIKLDEMIEMELNDFYDKVHTTPSGSKRIADVIYPELKKLLTKID